MLGYVGAITQEELDVHATSPKTYSLGDEVGKTGVEKTYEDDLRGTPGRQTLEVDAKGNTVRELSNIAPVPGDDLYLTIDANVQAITEQSLRDELVNAHNRRNNDGSYNASPAGASVIIDPNNGQVIAMASYPDYDPSEFTRADPQRPVGAAQRPEQLLPAQQPRACRASTRPGSTFKLVTALAGLRTGAITPATTINDTGTFHVPGCTGEQCTFKNSGGAGPWVGEPAPRAHRVERLLLLFARLAVLDAALHLRRPHPGNRAGSRVRIARAGVPLPGEQTGFVYTPDTLKAIHDKYPADYPNGDWYTGNNIQLAIGQNVVAVTPLATRQRVRRGRQRRHACTRRTSPLKIQTPTGEVVRDVRAAGAAPGAAAARSS